MIRKAIVQLTDDNISTAYQSLERLEQLFPLEENCPMDRIHRRNGLRHQAQILSELMNVAFPHREDSQNDQPEQFTGVNQAHTPEVVSRGADTSGNLSSSTRTTSAEWSSDSRTRGSDRSRESNRTRGTVQSSDTSYISCSERDA